ncbi:histidyl tRNA synthetase [Candidatus Propionivibrio aalborgensis]|uniref:Histidine--tRNA ligase n=1 Tax=Candidatus Propionivibrio aalborgensis TaxID=1860101 RepID=A0A1A8XLJ2_9RHOO|nr:histidine--tRNA ligase [Candidatus Propionivibrio aalborgensis]MBK7325195.1 histidine--tRNA ligase [Propionivibrio sp.]MBK7563046.1 histidine--tRNA ligase [Propionivibrio sp.]MBK9026350.1 histidine--tRNA ligase [Propionivibrio sp.]MBP6421525.1 histidine--tRNA ligase [Propionivibrio sp.]SBT04818.1 histidyl tRNA synthetase [Candidatus Propionivibrio aalborgensis]
MSQHIQSVRGMNDILPGEAEFWDVFEETVRSWLKSYGYRPIRLPIVEPTPLFKRAIGEVTDIVEKEMYSFVDSLNGEPLTLRPEGTAGCVRALIQHKLAAQQPQRLYYQGQMFRHERPQKGRYRQFNQVGVESFGFSGPDIDAEQILMGARLWADLGLDGIKLQLNTLGQPEERANHRAELIAYFEKYADVLDEDARRRLYTNPLRILDSKNPALQELIVMAPLLTNHLGSDSMAHFEGVQQVLRDAGQPFEINRRLVRGLDYYNLTVFEWVTDRLGAQGTVCAGGRYDGLVEQLGGKSTPACGFAMGVERLVALIRESGGEPALEGIDVYLVHQGEAASRLAPRVAEGLRDQGINVLFHCGDGGFKSQMKKADASGAAFAVIIGDDEANAGQVMLKPLRANGEVQNEQRRVGVDSIADEIMNSFLDWEEA